MGLLVDGEWHDIWYDTKSNDGRFVRADAHFRDRVTADGSSGFKAESGRYHLYVSYACPWAHRTLIYRKLKGLEDHISVSVVNPLMLDQGWSFEPADGVIPDPISGDFASEIRLGYQVKNGVREPFKGGMLVGNVLGALTDVRLSKETGFYGDYQGPTTARFAELTVTAGE